MCKNHIFLYIMAAAFLMLTLTACGQSSGPSHGTALGDIPQDTQDRPVPITHISYNDTLGARAASEDGVYLLQNIFPASENIFYIDAATKQEIFLCAAPNCKHNTTECTSYLPLEEGEYGHCIAYFQDSIYLFQCASHAKQPPHISRMDKDGSNRQDICFLNDGENFIGKMFGYGDDEILVETTYISQDEHTKKRLERIDCGSGERNILVEYPSEPYYGLMAAINDRLAFIKIDAAGRQYFWGDLSSGQQSLEESVKTAPIGPLFDGEKTSCTIQGDYLCETNTGAETLSATNLVTGQAYEFKFPEGLTQDDQVGLTYLPDDHFALTIYNNDPNHPETIMTQFLLDAETGELTDQQYSISRTNGRGVIAEIQDQVIYYARSEERLLENQAEYGLVGETCFLDVFGITSKDEFLQGKAGTEVSAATG